MLRLFCLGGYSLCATFRGYRLSYLPNQEGLEIGFVASPFQARNRMPGQARDEIPLSIGAGYFEFAGLALQGLGNVISRNRIV
jgi:hypothetical protein